MIPNRTLDRDKTVQKFKTKVCIFWLTPEGCPYGDRCLYAHGKLQLREDRGESNVPGIDPDVNERYKTRLCRFMLAKSPCPHGPRCTYAHSYDEQAYYINLAKAKGIQIPPHALLSAPSSPLTSSIERLAVSAPMTMTATTTTTRIPWSAQIGVSPFLTRPLVAALPTTTTSAVNRSMTPSTTTFSSTSNSININKTTTNSTPVSFSSTLSSSAAAKDSSPPLDHSLSSFFTAKDSSPSLDHKLNKSSSPPPGMSPSQNSQSFHNESYKPIIPSATLTANATSFVTGAASALLASETSNNHATAASHLSSTTPPINFERYRDPNTGLISVQRMSAGVLALYLNSAYVYDGETIEESSSVVNPSLKPPGLGDVGESSALSLALQAEELAGRKLLAERAKQGLTSVHQNLANIPAPPPTSQLLLTPPPLPSQASSWITQGHIKQKDIATAQHANDAVSNAIAQLVAALHLSEASRVSMFQHQFPHQAVQQQTPLDLMMFLDRAQSNLREQQQQPLVPTSHLQGIAHEWILGQSLSQNLGHLQPAGEAQHSFEVSNDSERSFLTLAATTSTTSTVGLSTSRASHAFPSSTSAPSSSRWPPSQTMSTLGETSSASTSKTCESSSNIWRPSAQSNESMILHKSSDSVPIPSLDLSRILQPHTIELLNEDEGEDDKGILSSLGLSKRDDDDDDDNVGE